MPDSTIHFAERERPLAVLRALAGDGRSLAIAAASAASFKAVLVKLAYAAAPVSPVVLLNLRMLFCLPLFWLMARRAATPLNRRQVGLLALMGFLGYYLSSLADFTGLQWISAGLERLILFTYPSLVFLLEVLTRRTRLNRAAAGAIALSYLGLVLAFGHDLRGDDSGLVWLGAAWVGLSAVAYALYHVGAASLIREIGAARYAGGVGLAATAFYVLHGALTEPLAAFLALPAEIYGYALVMALLCTVLPSWLAARAMARIGASATTAIGSLGPVLTLALGWLLLGEAFSWQQLAGMALVVAGISRLKT